MLRKYFKKVLKLKSIFILSLSLFSLMLNAQVRPHHIFDNNMVLQRDKPVKIWGWAAPQERVEIKFGGQIKSDVANQKGEWLIRLDPMTANAQPEDMCISGKNNSVVFTNVLVGDVWILGGQSNMEFDLVRIFYGDAEVLSANYPNIRLMTIPASANQEPKDDFERVNEYDSWLDRYEEKGYWFICSPKTVDKFSGLGYIFGKRIHMASQVPVGLIDLSRGGTTVEAWLSPGKLAKIPENRFLLNQWNDKVAAYNPEEDLRIKIDNWKKDSTTKEKQGLEPLQKPDKPSPSPAMGKNFPGSSYNGMVAVIAGLAVKGIVFHHGYNNAGGDSRPKLYALNFKALIADWRNTFNDKNLPFGIIEFSAGGKPQTLNNYESRMMDAAPYIREGQFKAFMDSPNTGFVCSYDQQVYWYHPHKKAEVAERMARWALSTQYGFDLKWEPTVCEGIEKLKNKIILTFSGEVKSIDDRPIEGFSIAGNDRHFYPAKAVYIKKENEKGQLVNDERKIEVWNNLVENPVEVRYAWARNPIGNLVNRAISARVIPVPPFRTDSWDYPEAPYSPEEYKEHIKMLRMFQQQANELTKIRIIMEAEELLKNK